MTRWTCYIKKKYILYTSFNNYLWIEYRFWWENVYFHPIWYSIDCMYSQKYGLYHWLYVYVIIIYTSIFTVKKLSSFQKECFERNDNQICFKWFLVTNNNKKSYDIHRYKIQLNDQTGRFIEVGKIIEFFYFYLGSLWHIPDITFINKTQ